MFYIILQPKVLSNSQASGEGEARETVRKVLAIHRVKVMTMFGMSEKEKGVSSKLELLAEQIAKQGKRVSSLIRIQLEDIKGRVRAQSPAALQFIGPGD
ncbi:hypothetical protein [Niallia sp. Krafla_26]|uniref:hypothetical protein n=1 Tax=Niallia sp. Krafla_26 TaxID=3064703 RepID=UPI003D1780D0